jgi:hypothetical protein
MLPICLSYEQRRFIFRSGHIPATRVGRVESLAFSAGCDDRLAIVINQLPSSTAPRSAARSVRHLLECLNVVRRQSEGEEAGLAGWWYM